MKLILASGSPYRRALLEKTGLPFDTCPADVDESRQEREEVSAYVARLALEKARKGALAHPDALVIGSDQACALDGRVLGKPGGRQAAFEQLRRCAGKWLLFHTGLALVHGPSGRHQLTVEPFAVRFRALSDAELWRYLDRDEPYDCAGSFKAEAAGILLFQEMSGRDFNSIIGLPLIALCDMLIREGLDPLGEG